MPETSVAFLYFLFHGTCLILSVVNSFGAPPRGRKLVVTLPLYLALYLRAQIPTLMSDDMKTGQVLLFRSGGAWTSSWYPEVSSPHVLLRLSRVLEYFSFQRRESSLCASFICRPARTKVRSKSGVSCFFCSLTCPGSFWTLY